MDDVARLKQLLTGKRKVPTIDVRPFERKDVGAVRRIFTDGMLSTISSGLRWKLVTHPVAAAYAALLATFALSGTELSRVFFVWALMLMVPVVVLYAVPDHVSRGYVAEAIVKKEGIIA